MRHAELNLMPFGQATIATEDPGMIPIVIHMSMTESENNKNVSSCITNA